MVKRKERWRETGGRQMRSNDFGLMGTFVSPGSIHICRIGSTPPSLWRRGGAHSTPFRLLLAPFRPPMAVIAEFSDGTELDLATRSGADAFLDRNNDRCYFCQLLDDIEFMLPKEETYGTARIAGNYCFIYYVALNGSRQKLNAQTNHEDWLRLCRHLEEQLELLVTNEIWLRTGYLPEHHQEMIHVLYLLLKHGEYAHLLAEQVAVLPKFVQLLQAREGCLSEKMAYAAISTCFRYQSTMEEVYNNVERPFLELEQYGLLAQCLRALTEPGQSDDEDSVAFLRKLMDQSRLIRKHFRPDTPTGTMLDDILAHRVGHPRPAPLVLQLFQAIREMCTTVSTPQSGGGNICRLCAKKPTADQPLRRCARCLHTWYCSKECQRQDWKKHKKTCQATTTTPSSTVAGSFDATPIDVKSARNLALSFVQNNYFKIAARLGEFMRIEGCEKNELLVLLDFHGPTARSRRGLFNIRFSSRLCFGKPPPDEPDWFGKGTDAYKANVKWFRDNLSDNVDRLRQEQILIVSRNPEGPASMYRVHLENPVTKESKFSDRCLRAFDAMDLGTLGQIYDPDELGRYQQFIQRRMLTIMQNGGRDPEDEDH